MTRRVTLREAARVLGISKEAVRKRVKWETLAHEKGEDGQVYVYLPDGNVYLPDGGDVEVDDGGDVRPEGGDRDPRDRDHGHPDHGRPDARDELVHELRGRVEDLRQQLDAERAANRENRRLLAAALERIPAIEAPREPRERHETPSGGPNRGEPRPAKTDAQEGAERRPSWWRRWFGG